MSAGDQACPSSGSHPSRPSTLPFSPEKGYTMLGNGLPSQDLSQQQGVLGGEGTPVSTATVPSLSLSDLGSLSEQQL